jgi:hypothetical protein
MKGLLKAFYNYFKDLLVIYISPLITPKKDAQINEEVLEGPYKKISICTTCMDRTIHLKKTYVNNVVNNLDYPIFHIILRTVVQKDEFHVWVIKVINNVIDIGFF